MTSPLERAARALQDELGGNLHETVDDELAAYLFRQAARAVLKAMREPSDAMVSRGALQIAEGDGVDVDLQQMSAAWQAMIDAALGEG